MVTDANTAGTEVQNQLTQSQAKYDELLRGMNLFLADTQSRLASVLIPKTSIVEDVRPVQSNYTFQAPNVPVSPALGSVNKEKPTKAQGVRVEDPSINGLAVIPTAPTLTFPTAPDSTLPTNSSTKPTTTDPTIPTKPTITQPAEPVLDTIPTYTSPDILLPTWESLQPSFTNSDPNSRHSFVEGTFTNSLRDALAAKIENDIVNGGTGLNNSVEAAMYDRGRSREEEVSSSDIDAITVAAASSGFPMPQGSLHRLTFQRNRERGEKISGLNREIIINQADLEQKNVQDQVGKGLTLTNLEMNFHHQVQSRAFDAAKHIIDAGIAAYNAVVSGFNARISNYTAYATSYKAQVEGELTKIEIFKAQWESSRIQAEVQKLDVDIYEAKIRANDSIINLYKTEMEAAKIEAEIERLKIDIYKTEVDAYVAEVGAKKAEFELYDTQIGAEKTRMEVYSEEVAAWKAEADGVLSQNRDRLSKAEIQLRQKQQESQEYRDELQAYMADMDSVYKENQNLLKKHSNELERHNIERVYDGMRVQWETTKLDNETSQQVNTFNGRLQQSQANLQESLKTVQMGIDANVGGSQVYSNAISSLISSVTGVLQLGSQFQDVIKKNV